MNALVNFLSIPLLAELVVALLHTLWQGCVIAAVLFVFLKAKAAKNANLRYAAAVVSLILIVICGLVTWSIAGYQPPPAAEQIAEPTKPDSIAAGDSTKAEQSVAPTIVAERQPSARVESEDAAATNWQAWAMCVWLAGVVVMVGRIFYMVIGVKRIRRHCRPVEDEHILAILAELLAAMKISRRIRIALAEHILSPGVIGFIKPTLLLPVSMLSGMSVEDIKAVLAHELAHIRRYDCLMNFCQMVVEAILFFNPAAWWISRQIRIEREVCCDAATVAITGREIGYAQLLFDWAVKLPAKRGGAATAAMAGFGEDNNEGRMLDRVKRIVVKDHRPGARISWYMTLAMLAAVGVVLVGLWQGTNVTVTFAGKLLTPQERIEKSAEIEKTHGQPAYDPDYREKTADEEKVTLAGTIRTWDGRKLPRSADMNIYHSHRNSSAIEGVLIKSDESGLAKFSTTAGQGTFWLSAEVEGYAPFFAGPFKLEPGDEKTDFEIVLEKGVTAY
ncbi:MAG: M56 family metallopeptidase, partial [Planctomycetota bacterium]